MIAAPAPRRSGRDVLRCLFWNLNRKDLSAVLAEAAAELRLDVLAVCEFGGDSRTLSRRLGREYRLTTGLFGSRLQLYTAFPSTFVHVRDEADRYLIIEVAAPVRERFLLMLVHGPSRGAGETPSSLTHEAGRYGAALSLAQRERKTDLSLVVGDLNMNPFDPGVYGAGGFHASADRRDADSPRTVRRTAYPRMYNPMWNLFGDDRRGPPGSYHYPGTTTEELGWHLFDQVLVSPAMVEHFRVPSLRVLDRIGDRPLVTDAGRPKKSDLSDHLPLYFELTV